MFHKLACLVLACLLVGCVPLPAALATVSASQTPAVLPTTTPPFPTDEPPVVTTPTTTARVTVTAPSISTATVAPPLTPGPFPFESKNGWYALASHGNLWVVHADGTKATLADQGEIEELSASPNGGMVAYIYNAVIDNPALDQPYGYFLKLLHLPSGEVQSITSLDLKGITASSSLKEMRDAFKTICAFDLAWSPDGKYLAFTSGHAGTSTDLFVYVISTGEIRRLSDGPSNAYDLNWSPDGTHIFHTGVWSFGTGAGYSMAGAWVASVWPLVKDDVNTTVACFRS